MKTILIVVISTAFFLFCNTKAEQMGEVKKTTASYIDTLYFQTKVIPVLKKNCSPCHFPNGKMYDKMPFDKPETIIGHEAGALKRFKDPNELILVKNFIEQNK